VPTGTGEFTVNAADPLAITALFFAVVYAATGRFLQLLPRHVVLGTCGIAAALLLGGVVAWLGPGLSKWAVLNRMVGFLFLAGYAAVPGVVIMIAGERGRAVLVDAFVAAAVVICAFQLLALAIDRIVAPLPPDFFGYAFATGGQLEGYAQNANAFAFQLLMALAVLIGWRSPVAPPTMMRWRLIGAAVLLVALVLTRSRAGIICGLGTLALAAVLWTIPARLLLARRTIVIGLIAGAALVGLAIALRGGLDRALVAPFGWDWRPLAGASDAMRWQSNVLGWQAWLQHPVLGGGLGSFLVDRERAGLPALVIHSVPIWFMAEMGLAGLAAYVVFIASLLAAGLAALRRGVPQARGLLLVVAAFVVMSLVHDLFFQRTFWFAAALLLVDAGACARASVPARAASAVSGSAP
jgi:hypothetical protein